MVDTAEKRMSLADFLAWDDGKDTCYELVGGVALAMAPPAPPHGTIVTNLGFEFRSRLRAPCRAITEAGIVPSDRADTYYQADLAVTCVPPKRDERWVPDPRVVVEVLSPSTAAHDRVGKLADYRRLASVQEIVLIASKERRAELWRRQADRWEVEDLIGEAVIRLDSIGVEFPLLAVYENVAL